MLKVENGYRWKLLHGVEILYLTLLASPVIVYVALVTLTHLLLNAFVLGILFLFELLFKSSISIVRFFLNRP